MTLRCVAELPETGWGKHDIVDATAFLTVISRFFFHLVGDGVRSIFLVYCSRKSVGWRRALVV